MRRLLGIISAAPSAAPVQFDPAGSNAGFTFSNANLTATRGPGGTDAIAIANASRSTGKHFFSITPDVAADSTFLAIGLAAVAVDYLGSAGGGGGNSVGYWGEGYLVINDDWDLLIDPFVAGDVVDIAVDFDAGLIWGRVNGGNWNANALADPATGVGGKDISALVLPSFPAADLINEDDAATANFGASAYTYGAPSGFANFTVSAVVALTPLLNFALASNSQYIGQVI